MRRTLQAASATATGTLAGAMLLIRIVLVPFWRRTATTEFKPWFASNAPRLRALMVPLGVTPLATTTANALVTRRGRAAMSAAAAAGVVAITTVINEPLNARFEGPEPVDPADVERWARWHDLRVALGFLSAWTSATPSGRC
jgi:hypothetical protein